MATLFNILKMTVASDKLTARVLVNPGMPLSTSEDVEATARVYYLAPAIAGHLCLGDAGSKFQDCMGNTEVAHLLEHLTVEIMNETGLRVPSRPAARAVSRPMSACLTLSFRARMMRLRLGRCRRPPS